MLVKTIRIVCVLSVLGAMSGSPARADEWNKKTVLTFSQTVEIAGHVLPAGAYTFQLMDSLSDRHIVQISNADGSKPIAIVMAIPDHRLKATDETVITFREVPAGSPVAVRAWFYPGNNVGQAFVYPKSRALALARASKVTVPALASDVTDDQMKTATIVAVTPDERETPVALSIQTTPLLASSSKMSGGPATELPRTASLLPAAALGGLGTIGLALGLLWFGKSSSPQTA